MTTFICKFCEKTCKNHNSLRNHERLCKLNPNRQKSPFETKQPTERSNQFIKAKKMNIEVYGEMTDSAKRNIAKLNSEREYSIETRLKMSAAAIKRNLGGHTSKQKLYFKKKDGDIVYLQSSYEVKFAELLEELNLTWERPDPFTWKDEFDKVHRYYPDFKVGNKYFDTKNDYLILKDADKIARVSSQNCVKIEVVAFKDIKKEYIEKALFV